MVKKTFVFIIICLLVLMVGFTTALATDMDSCVTIGVDNTEEQIKQVYGFFRINRGDVKELQVTNAEERKYLESAVPEEKIGSVALSCIYIETRNSGGLELETYNINWVTDEMYKSALTTAGITDAKVIVAAAKPVSGTGALTGVYKAYENLSGEALDEILKGVATEELVVTGELQEVLGDVSSDIINDLKQELERTKTMSDDEIRALIKEVAARYDVTLTSDQVEEILALIKKLNESGVDPETFLKIAEVGEGAKGFFDSVGDFFKGIGDYFKNIFQ